MSVALASLIDEQMTKRAYSIAKENGQCVVTRQCGFWILLSELMCYTFSGHLCKRTH